MGKTISDLHELLFETIESVKNGKMAPDVAKTIADVGQVMVNAAKAEISYKNLDDRYKSSFLDDGVPKLPSKQDGLPPGINSITVHRMK